MIIINFLIDYIIMLLFPINTYFIIHEIDKDNIYNIIITSMILDILYYQLLNNLILLLSIYYLVKKIKIKNKNNLLKNILIFIIFFNITYFLNGYNITKYLSLFITSTIFQIIYMCIYKRIKIYNNA